MSWFGKQKANVYGNTPCFLTEHCVQNEISDNSKFIMQNRSVLFHGNLQLTSNIMQNLNKQTLIFEIRPHPNILEFLLKNHCWKKSCSQAWLRRQVIVEPSQQ